MSSFFVFPKQKTKIECIRVFVSLGYNMLIRYRLVIPVLRKTFKKQSKPQFSIHLQNNPGRRLHFVFVVF